ncbi:putative NAD dependent epimerase [Rosellinia necatrix]|uniref:Putative NAD dependent epimerase n=1 Tax=Rosellinia necatrix TaxID=77044 RepID=A0A1S7UL33_ROSNE|nr:putative NAD dependent epimerase [Rosellinia necatrix]
MIHRLSRATELESNSGFPLNHRTLAWTCANSTSPETGMLPDMSTAEGQRKPTVLMTGLNGYLAGRTAELVLLKGYRIRGTVRNKLAGQKVKAALCRLGHSADDIDVVHIPDICQPDAFDAAADGCCAILHLAAPIADIWTLPPPEIVRVAVESTVNILRAATKTAHTMSGVVLVSSSAALFDIPWENRMYTEADWNANSEEIVRRETDKAGGFHGYLASKTAAEKIFWKFRDDHRPSFGMTTLQPSYFIGPPLIPWKTAADIPYSNSDFWKVVSGEEPPGPMMIYSDTIDIRDVARMLLWSAMNPEDADGQRFICSSAVGGGQAIADILRKRMPCLNVRVGQPGEGYSPDYKPQKDIGGFDSSKAVSVTGEDWIPYQESVLDLARYMQRYLSE